MRNRRDGEGEVGEAQEDNRGDHKATSVGGLEGGDDEEEEEDGADPEFEHEFEEVVISMRRDHEGGVGLYGERGVFSHEGAEAVPEEGEVVDGILPHAEAEGGGRAEFGFAFHDQDQGRTGEAEGGHWVPAAVGQGG